MTPDNHFFMTKIDREELQNDFERTDAMKPRMHSGCRWASMPQQQDNRMKTEAQSIDEIEFNTVEHSVRVTVQMINRKINPDIESEIALVAVHKAKVLAQLENITLGTYQSKKNDGNHIVVIQCDDEDDVSSASDKLDKVLASFNNPNYEVYVNEW